MEVPKLAVIISLNKYFFSFSFKQAYILNCYHMIKKNKNISYIFIPGIIINKYNSLIKIIIKN